MKVLAIEDDPISAMQLAAVLKSLGHDASHASNVEDAWTQIARGEIRVVVCDWMMPGKNGLDLCRMVRESGNQYVYFILISSVSVNRENRAEATAAGVDDFLGKPVDPDELSSRLHVADRIVKLTAQVKQLESFLPVCTYCKKVRGDQQYWQAMEAYFADKGGTRFSHGICPECYEEHVAPQLKALGIDRKTP